MKNPNFVSGREGLNFGSAVEAMIKRSCIIDYGIIQNIVAEGVVDVSVAVASTKQDMIGMTCVLANIASSSFTLNIKPKVGDRVLVVYPRLFNDKMFNITGNEDDKQIIVDKEARGYNLMSGIAILLNQYKKDKHTNLITIEDGKISVNTVYDEDNQEYKFSFTTDENGAYSVSTPKSNITVDSDGKLLVNMVYDEDNQEYKFVLSTDGDGAYSVNTPKSKIGVNKDGYLDYSISDENNNTSFKFSDDGFTIKDKVGNNIVSTTTQGSESITINGNLKVKK
jgi:hypothetical protein